MKEKTDDGIEFPFVRSDDQLAYILTKAVTWRIFTEVLCKLSIGDPLLNLKESIRSFYKQSEKYQL